MHIILPEGFDYAKFAASLTALIVAVLGITFKYKLVTRSDDPAQPEKERLSGLGVVAIILILLGGGFSIYSDAKSQVKKEAANEKAIQDLAAARKAQEALNRSTDSILQQMRTTLSEMRSAARQRTR